VGSKAGGVVFLSHWREVRQTESTLSFCTLHFALCTLHFREPPPPSLPRNAGRGARSIRLYFPLPRSHFVLAAGPHPTSPGVPGEEQEASALLPTSAFPVRPCSRPPPSLPRSTGRGAGSSMPTIILHSALFTLHLSLLTLHLLCAPLCPLWLIHPPVLNIFRSDRYQ
jgi:hypothetical protein